MALLIALLGACSGCRPDFPDLPDGNSTVPPGTDTDTDTAPDSAPIDSGPPARCDVEEVEPNDTPDAMQVLPMEQWACGGFSKYLDSDWLSVTPTQSGWVKIEVQAASRGSSADPQIQVFGDVDSALVGDGFLTTDPLLVFPAPDLETYRLALAETNLLYGDDYGWYILASLTKEPVSWDFVEAEPNDTWLEAQEFHLDETLFGTIGEAGDFDWYKITTPADGEVTLDFDVTAFTEGSAADLMLVLYDADGATEIKRSYSGEISYDRDPLFQKKTIAAGSELYLLARTEDDKGSRFHWYTLSISATLSE
jgi:hypothetical protein